MLTQRSTGELSPSGKKEVEAFHGRVVRRREHVEWFERFRVTRDEDRSVELLR